MRPALLAGTLVALLALAGCGSDTATQSSTPPMATSPPTASASGAKLVVRQTGLGRTLVDGAGRTLYLFEKDQGARSACYGACAQAWPPFTTSSRPAAGAGAAGAAIGTSRRRDGAKQVTYAGHPLYFYAADRRPGDTRGQHLEQFGAEWYALGPTGSQIEDRGGNSSGGSGGGGSGGYGSAGY
jgi:predicted lipoprotein with Yx(FWY)xxD motif